MITPSPIRNVLNTVKELFSKLPTSDWLATAIACLSLILFYSYRNTDWPNLAYFWDQNSLNTNPSQSDFSCYTNRSITAVCFRIWLSWLFIKFTLEEGIKNFGWSRTSSQHSGGIYVTLFVLMLPILIIVSFEPSFQNSYPQCSANMEQPVELVF